MGFWGGRNSWWPRRTQNVSKRSIQSKRSILARHEGLFCETYHECNVANATLHVQYVVANPFSFR